MTTPVDNPSSVLPSGTALSESVLLSIRETNPAFFVTVGLATVIVTVLPKLVEILVVTDA